MKDYYFSKSIAKTIEAYATQCLDVSCDWLGRINCCNWNKLFRQWHPSEHPELFLLKFTTSNFILGSFLTHYEYPSLIVPRNSYLNAQYTLAQTKLTHNHKNWKRVNKEIISCRSKKIIIISWFSCSTVSQRRLTHCTLPKLYINYF